MSRLTELGIVALIGLVTTSSCILGVAVGLYAPLSKRALACVLAFAAGALIGALAIELAFEGAEALHRQGFGAQSAWAFVGGGFAIGAVTYYAASLFLEQRGAAVRYPTRFREYALERKQRDAKALIKLLAKCDLLRHLPPEEIEQLLPCVGTHRLVPGEVLFRAGDPGDALYIVASGKVEILDGTGAAGGSLGRPLAELGEGQAFGEMALLSRGPRTATARAMTGAELLKIEKAAFEHLVATDDRMATAVERLSHGRAMNNLSAGTQNPAIWLKVASGSVEHLSRHESAKLLSEASRGSGLAIVLGNILDTIPGCLVIGAKFDGLDSLSLTLVIGMFLGGIPEAAASAAMLVKARYRPAAIFTLWSTVLVAGTVAAVTGKIFIKDAESLVAIFSEALAGGAVLALVAHAMIPEALHEGGSLIVLPTVAGFLFALYLALGQAFH
jgi:CRP-like cAMP-binding protein